MNPIAATPTDRISTLGEVALLKRMRAWFGASMPPSPEGMGDDCAVLKRAAGNLLAADSLLRGRHFDDHADPAQVGAKLLLRNLSDIAAMGGEPQYALISGFLPPDTSLQWLERFCRGMSTCAAEYSTALVGGDLTESVEGPGFSLAIAGQAKRPLLRTGSHPGDSIWVTGFLGGSILGRHLCFPARIPEGRWLAQRQEIHACMDLTDGLGKDLHALLQGGLAAALDIQSIPVSRDARLCAERSGLPPLHHALNDGEDYELLFTLGVGTDPDDFKRQWNQAFDTPISCIGVIRPLEHHPVFDATTGNAIDSAHGYTHFG